MVLRAPPPSLQPDKYKLPDDNAAERWQTYECTLVTPLFGGGVQAGEVDRKMPVRASAIRGQLRFWWRLLAHQEWKLGDIASHEAAIFGGVAKETKASKVFLKISQVATPQTMPPETAKELSRYALFPLESSQASGPVAREGITFQLGISMPKLDETAQKQVHEALRWWATFGGIGGRTRRGLGKIQLAGLPPITAEQASAAGCRLVTSGDYASATEAWKKAIEKLKNFRQGTGQGQGRNPGQGNRPGRSRWPEPDAIRRYTGKNANGKHEPVHPAGNVFPRAALGMPIIFEIRGPGEPSKSSLQPLGKERMASPVILQPYPSGNNRWRAAALLLPNDHVWQTPLELKGTNAPTIPAGQWWPNDARQRTDLATKIIPMNTRGDDPLTAFLKFFEGN